MTMQNRRQMEDVLFSSRFVNLEKMRVEAEIKDF